MANFGRIFRSETAEDIDSVRKSAAEYREAVGDFLKSSIAEQKQLSDAVKSSSERVLEVSSTVDATVKQIQSAASQQQSEFSAAQDKRATEFSASQAEFLSKFTETLAAHNTEFTEDQNQRKSSYSELEVATKKQIGDLISNFNEQLKSHEQSYLADEKILKDSSTEKLDGLNLQFSEKAKGVLGEIQAMRSQVENLVGVIGNLGVTAGYKKVADEAKKMLYIWQFVTVASLVGLIMVAGSTAISVNALDAETVELIKLSIASGKPAVDGSLLDKAGNTFFYQKLLSRLVLSVTFGVFATYSAKQASRFFEVEKRNRKLALELEALGPFIEPLDKHDKDKFRVQVGDRSFGVPDGSVKIDNESESVTLLDWLKSKDGLENLVGQVKKIWKAD